MTLPPGSVTRNPGAPPALDRFAFLIGDFQCQARLKSPDGAWQSFSASWHGRFILDGHAIADEYSMTSAAGERLVLGMNFRSYDAARQVWHIKWLNALDGAWSDLAPSAFGGVTMDDDGISYAFREPSAVHACTRAIYTNITDKHFTWRGDKSEDGRVWNEFMIVECDRRAS